MKRTTTKIETPIIIKQHQLVSSHSYKTTNMKFNIPIIDFAHSSRKLFKYILDKSFEVRCVGGTIKY